MRWLGPWACLLVGCQCEPTQFLTRPLVPDAGQPTFLDEPCELEGTWQLSYDLDSVTDACLPPDSLFVELDANGCSLTTLTTLPGPFVARPQPKSIARCRATADACRIAVDLTMDAAHDHLRFTLSLRRTTDGTFAGTTSMQLDSCAPGVRSWPTRASR